MKTFIQNFNLSFINDYALFIYLILAAIIICFMIVFVNKIIKLNNAVNLANNQVNGVIDSIEDSKFKAEVAIHGANRRSSLVFKTLALFNVMRYTMNKENRQFARNMREYEKHKKDKQQLR